MEKSCRYIGKWMGPDDPVFQWCIFIVSQFHTTAAVGEGLICQNTSDLLKTKKKCVLA
jgi:hypothetical protein